MMQTITIENTKSLKIRITAALVSLLLALAAAAVASQSPAVATPASSDTARDKAPSLATAKPAKSTLGESAKTPRVPSTGEAASSNGRMGAQRTTIGASGRSGAVQLGPAYGLGYYAGRQYASTPLANIWPSPSYRGNQIVTMRTLISRQSLYGGRLGPTVLFANHVKKYTIGSRGVQIPAQWYGSPDVGSNFYNGYVEIWWQTPSGQTIGYQKSALNHASDYACAAQNQTSSSCGVLYRNPTYGLHLNSTALGY